MSELQNRIKESGKTVTYLAKKMNRSRPYVYRKMKNPELFVISDINILCEELNIKDSEILEVFKED